MGKEKNHSTVRKVHISEKDILDDEFWARQPVENRLLELQRLRLFVGQLNEEFKITTFKKVVQRKPIYMQDV